MTDPIAAEGPFTAFSFNQYLKEHKLMGSRCTRCGALYLPPETICGHCHVAAMEWVELSGKGRLAGYTVIGNGLSHMIKAGYSRDNPYATGIVGLAEGLNISARILGMDVKKPESIKIGTPLVVEFIAQGEGETQKTYLAFRVADGA